MTTTTQLIFMIASVTMTCIIFIFVYGFRKERGIHYLLGVIVCRIIYVSGVIMERSSDTLQEKLFFRNIHQTALDLMVPFFVLFVLELVAYDKLLRIRGKMMLIVAFALWSMLMWFDSDLHVIYRKIELHDGHLVVAKTIYSITFSMICYSMLAVCFYFLFQYVRNIRKDMRSPGMWVLCLISISGIIEIVKLINPGWSSWLLPMSVYCSFLGMLVLIILLRYKFFSLVPFARNIVLDTLQESILIANASGKVIDSNKQASQWFSKMGYASLSGRNISELLERWPHWNTLCQSMQQGNVEIDAWLDGGRNVYSVNVYPLQTLRRKEQGSISLIFDITEKQRHLDQIAQLNQLKDQLFTIVSHDIRSPLALQFQLVELLEEERDRFGTDHREIVEMLGDQIRNTLGMATNLLEWFRSQREDMALRPQLLELSEVVEECCHVLHIKSEAKQIRVHHHIASGTRVYADREALGLIIRNLVSNAIKFTGWGGSIHVHAQLSGDKVIVSVRDNGVGMEEDQARQLFSENQLHSLPGTMGEKGAGLGLLVSQQFVQRSGGRIWVESKAGQGSVFYFTMRGEQRDESSHS
ncbi:Adaptive-response sensory-kinase SasA [Paenibacillus solanacearum]|uniref:histidine kinase n=1 Tax=Paenibacillus solanacearum TaxID=2048548 RepID=A0A916K537_9BACL|nr:ATP-binding protein [Paenibacillus solanacearum]CAG7627070.1 Adaptive-response sensory-kinase SasA [Paenibacillus solanacearum]